MDLLATIPWYVGVIFRVALGFGIAPYMIKLLADRGSIAQKFFAQASICLGIAVVIELVFQTPIDSTTFLISVAIGAIGSLGNYFYWKATAVSMSRNAMLTYWDDIIAMTLSFFILHEAAYLTGELALGIVLSIVAMLAFAVHAAMRGDAEKSASLKSLSIYVALYSVLWGLAYFGQKYASTKSLPPHVFALAWYLGSAPIAGLFYLKKRNEAVRLERSDWKKIVLLSGVLYVSMASSIIAFRAPQIVVQPIFFAAEIALPVLMGLFLFHERKKVVGIEWLFFTLGIFGTALIVHAFAMR